MKENLNQDNITPTSPEGPSGEEMKKDFKGLVGKFRRFIADGDPDGHLRRGES